MSVTGDILRVENLVAGYARDLPILRSVNLSLRERSVTVIIGPNGAGKSTLIKAIAGLVPVSAGAVHLGGRDITRIRPDQLGGLGISYVPQNDNIFRTLTIRQNLLLSLRKPKPAADGADAAWSPLVSSLVFLGVGLYGGAFQAGVGLILLAALTRTGIDLVVANSIKVVVILVVTATALPVFIASGKVDWPPALVLGAGFAVGGAVGARLAVSGGERVIRGVMIVAVLAASGRLLGLY